MVEMEAGGPARAHRIDAVAAAAIVLTVDAVLLLAIAVIGVPFLMFVFADEMGTWQNLWPYAASWLVACVLAAVCATAVAVLTGYGNFSIRRVGTAAALGVAVTAAVIAAASVRTSPSGILIGLPFAVANLAAALVFASPDRAAAVADRFPLFRAAPGSTDDVPEPGAQAEPATYEQDEAAYARPATEDGADEPVKTRDTIDLRAFSRPAPVTGGPAAVARRRGPAAMRTLAGVQLPRRARRTRPTNRPVQ